MHHTSKVTRTVCTHRIVEFIAHYTHILYGYLTWRSIDSITVHGVASASANVFVRVGRGYTSSSAAPLARGVSSRTCSMRTFTWTNHLHGQYGSGHYDSRFTTHTTAFSACRFITSIVSLWLGHRLSVAAPRNKTSKKTKDRTTRATETRAASAGAQTILVFHHSLTKLCTICSA